MDKNTGKGKPYSYVNTFFCTQPMYDQSIILFAIGLEICDLSATYGSHTKNVHREEWSRKNGSIWDIYIYIREHFSTSGRKLRV